MSFSTLRDAVPCLGLDQYQQTPIQLLSSKQVSDNLKNYFDSVAKIWPSDADFYYAMKANPNEIILKLAIEAGYGIECGGMSEIQQAIQSGARFIVNGSGKSNSVLELTAANHGLINIDSLNELQDLNELGITANIALRLKFSFIEDPIDQQNFYFPPGTPTVNAYLKKKRWGMPLADVESILTNELPAQLNFEGLHIHLGKLGKTLESYKVVARDLAIQINDLAAKSKYEIKSINLGGGWNKSNPNPDNPAFSGTQLLEAFLLEFQECLKFKQMPKLILELGQAIVGDAGCTLTKVTSTKFDSESQIHWTHIDASSITTNPIANSLNGANFEVSNLSNQNGQTIKTTVVGAPCMGGPLTQNTSLAQPRKNDLLAIWDTGAYSYGLQRDFNGYSGAKTLWLETELNKNKGEQ